MDRIDLAASGAFRGRTRAARRAWRDLRNVDIDWYFLHDVPLPDGRTVEHLVVGPGGVFVADAAQAPVVAARLSAATGLTIEVRGLPSMGRSAYLNALPPVLAAATAARIFHTARRLETWRSSAAAVSRAHAA